MTQQTGSKKISPIESRRRTRGVALIAAFAAAGISLSACNLVGGTGGHPPEPAPPPTTADIRVSTSFPYYGSGFCEVDSTTQWGAVPLSVPPGPGRSTPITEQSQADKWLPSSDKCEISHDFNNFQPGKWRVWVAAGTASGTCEADFKAGASWVTFINGACSVTDNPFKP
jgi:hypothetical protein